MNNKTQKEKDTFHLHSKCPICKHNRMSKEHRAQARRCSMLMKKFSDAAREAAEVVYVQPN